MKNESHNNSIIKLSHEGNGLQHPRGVDRESPVDQGSLGFASSEETIKETNLLKDRIYPTYR